MILKLGNEIKRVAGDAKECSVLPAANYQLMWDDRQSSYYLKQIAQQALPSRIYGNCHKDVDYWLKTINARSNRGVNTGILLSGLKGAGKTVTSKLLCINSQRPIINIADCFTGNSLLEFLSEPGFKGAIIYVDEFEKVYRKQEEQESFLQLMDGSLSNDLSLVFLLTVNRDNISEYMINRPGRILFRKHYDEIEADTIQEICLDLLNNKSHVQDILKFFDITTVGTFDVLFSIIELLNLHPELTTMDVVNSMCVSLSEAGTYEVIEQYKGTQYEVCSFYTDSPVGQYLESRHLERKAYQSTEMYKEVDKGLWRDETTEVDEDDGRYNAIEAFLSHKYFSISNVEHDIKRVNKNLYEITFKQIPNYKILVNRRKATMSVVF